MKVNELRVGNYVKDSNGEIYQITPRFFSSIAGGRSFEEQRKAGYEDLNYSVNPIPLTPEILEKCGFEQQLHTFDWSLGYNFKINQEFILVYRHDNFYYIDAINNEIKYLHQLQNLYFALTGEELEGEM